MEIEELLSGTAIACSPSAADITRKPAFDSAGAGMQGGKRRGGLRQIQRDGRALPFDAVQ